MLQVKKSSKFRLWGRRSDDLPTGAVIGVPYNVQHVLHVKPDLRTSTGNASYTALRCNSGIRIIHRSIQVLQSDFANAWVRTLLLYTTAASGTTS
jgi:hypothetical protein